MRGYHTRLQSSASAILCDKGLPHDGEDLFGSYALLPPEALQQHAFKFRIPEPMTEGIIYDCVEIFRGVGDLSNSHAQIGLVVHEGYDSLTVALLCGQWVSVEQPAGTALYHMQCYKILAALGCVVTTFTYCTFGSPFS